MKLTELHRKIKGITKVSHKELDKCFPLVSVGLNGLNGVGRTFKQLGSFSVHILITANFTARNYPKQQQILGLKKCCLNFSDIS